MTGTQQLNSLVIGLPLAIALFAIFKTGILVFALLATIITGFVQISIGLGLLFDHYKNRHLQIYFLLCTLFFSLWYATDWEWIWVLPLILAIYMTIILHFIIIEE